MHWLSLSIWWPVLAGLFIIVLCGADKRPQLARVLALLSSIIGFLICMPILFGFNGGNDNFQFQEVFPIMLPPADAQGVYGHLTIFYYLGVDGISLWLLILNSFITVLVMIFAGQHLNRQVPQYLAAFLIMSGLLNGVFLSLDVVMFYVFFEASLIPMYLIIGIWGGQRRVYAAFKFFLYTMLGSLLLLIAIVYMYWQTGHFLIAGLDIEIGKTMGIFETIPGWIQTPLPLIDQKWLFAAMMIAFAIKVPMWPVHTWLPDAHVEAPTGGSVVLAAIMLKLGTYGMLRFAMPVFPDAAQFFAPVMIGLSLVAIIYIGLVAIVQEDMKKMIAYSSIAHMGFVTLGLFLYDILGWEGAIIQMVSHGFISAALFFSIGVLYDRMHTRMISSYGGVVNVMPKFAALMMLFVMANSGLPATSGFVGEFFVMMAAAKFNIVMALAAGTTLIFSAGYSLWLYKRVIFGVVNPAHSQEISTLKDIDSREKIVLAILAILILAMGIYPKPVNDLVHPAAAKWLRYSQATKII